MKTVATIGLVMLPDGNPGVRFTGSEDFSTVPNVVQVAMLIAAMQLCMSAINSIYGDSPEDAGEIEQMLDSVTLIPHGEALN